MEDQFVHLHYLKKNMIGKRVPTYRQKENLRDAYMKFDRNAKLGRSQIIYYHHQVRDQQIQNVKDLTLLTQQAKKMHGDPKVRNEAKTNQASQGPGMHEK